MAGVECWLRVALIALMAAAPAVAGRSDAYSQPIAGLTAAEQQRFDQGDRLFATRRSLDGRHGGLGPTYIARACADCHRRDGRSRPPDLDDPIADPLSLRWQTPNGSPLPNYGLTLSTASVPGVPAEARLMLDWTQDGLSAEWRRQGLRWPRPALRELAFGPLPADVRMSLRMAPAIVGLGLLEAIPVDQITVHADPQDRDGNGVSGRAAWVHGRLGRFGWKATLPTLHEAVASAAHLEMGMRTARYPQPDCPGAQDACRAAAGLQQLPAEEWSALAFYLATHAVPEPAIDPTGAERFERVGCANCHRPLTGMTGSHPVAALAHRPVHAYTDLLLHDLGQPLSDGFVEGAAEAREWRTAPLWGLGAMQAVNGHLRLLHDGRARGVHEAILWHGGEAAAARARYLSLPEPDRQRLRDFVESR